MSELNCYRIVSEEDGSDLIIGNTALSRFELTEEQEEFIRKEIDEWELIRDVKGSETLYWHDDDVIDHSSIARILHYYGSGVILKDGHFYGVIVNIKNTASSGMSVYQEKDIGFVCIDGNKDGVTEEHEFHSSSEVSWEHNVTYYLKKKDTSESISEE